MSGAALKPVQVASMSLERFAAVLPLERLEEVRAGIRDAKPLLAGRRVWNVSSTAHGGGVAEMLTTLLAYARGAGVDARWEVIAGSEEFFAVTKRMHNRLHGFGGDHGALGEAERRCYEATLAPSGEALGAKVRSGDVVILHDPQTAGLIPALKARGIPVVWRCHVGVDQPNEQVHEVWGFLERYVASADAAVFSRTSFIWDVIDPARIAIIAPSLDAFAPKNQQLDEGSVEAILVAVGLREGELRAPAAFTRMDDRPDLVRRSARLMQERPLRREERFVVQVSRWDALKDPGGVVRGFAEFVAPHSDAHLVYAGPDVEGVSDDPEGARVVENVRQQWRQLPTAVRERIHLAELPMNDAQENGAMVNALQQAATVVVQKSLAEGFGLTVAEAMWKSRPVAASRIGGIQDQIEHGRSGLLLAEPRALEAFGEAVRQLLDNVDSAHAMGGAARERVRERFLGPRSLLEYLKLIRRLI
jgi:trehalose synthase